MKEQGGTFKWNIGCVYRRKVVSSRQLAEYLKVSHDEVMQMIVAAESNRYKGLYEQQRDVNDALELFYESAYCDSSGKQGLQVWMNWLGFSWVLVVAKAFPFNRESHLYRLLCRLARKVEFEILDNLCVTLMKEQDYVKYLEACRLFKRKDFNAVRMVGKQ